MSDVTENTTESKPKTPAAVPSYKVVHNDVIALWCVRLIVATKQFQRLRVEYERNALMPAMGIEPIDYPAENWSVEQWETLIGQRHSELERMVLSYADYTVLENAELLADILGLDQTDAEMLALAVLMDNNPAFEACVEHVSRWTVLKASRAIGRTLGVPDREVRARLHCSAPLGALGLVRLVKPSDYADSPFEVQEHLTDVLQEIDTSRASMMGSFFEQAKPSTLAWTNYAHIEGIEVLDAILRSAVDKRRVGANVLLWGPPGTGKTELARLLADCMGAQLYVVAVHGNDGAVLSSNDRLGAYQACQRVVAQDASGMVLFDEVEDVFAPPNIGARPMKGSMNRILETNLAPAIWITNNVSRMDPAYLRRFDLALELPVPPRPVRRRMVDALFDNLPTSETWRETVSHAPELVPADLARAASVATALDRNAKVSVQDAMNTVLSGTLRVRTGRRLDRHGYTLVNDFDPRWLNTNVPVAPLLDGLRTGGQGSVLLFGPPGTGKTAWTWFLARELGREIEHLKMSDLISCWVGETEQRIARAFDDARHSNAVLFFDEADGMLRDRRSARNSWEVTQVNEFLVQLEAFDGVCVCSTNLDRDLDRAAFRRFAAKVRFDPLTAPQRVGLVEQVLAGVSLTMGEADTARLGNLTRLTPGDIAAARKRFALTGGIPSGAEFVTALEEECAALGEVGVDQRIGF